MKRAFYIDNQYVDRCWECYFDAPHCYALKGLEYHAQYDRKTDCDSVYINNAQINADDFKKTLYKKDTCDPKKQHPYIHSIIIDFPRGNRACCQQSIRNGTEDELCGCAIIEMMDKNKLPYRIEKQFGLVDHVDVKELNKKLFNEKCWLFDLLYIRGMCMGCKWHAKCTDGDLAQCFPDKDVCKPYVSSEDCPSRKMIRDGYSLYEAHVKCLACSEAIKWQLKWRNQVHAL